MENLENITIVELSLDEKGALKNESEENFPKFNFQKSEEIGLPFTILINKLKGESNIESIEKRLFQRGGYLENANITKENLRNKKIKYLGVLIGKSGYIQSVSPVVMGIEPHHLSTKPARFYHLIKKE